MIKKIADVLLQTSYEPGVKIDADKPDRLGNKQPGREHIAEDATAHFVIKKLFQISKENKELTSKEFFSLDREN